MENKNYTCKTHLIPGGKDGEAVAAIRIDRESHHIHHIPCECIDGLKMSHDQTFMTGPIADKLYAYEQLGYSPEALKKIIERYRKHVALRIAVHSVYGAMGLNKTEFDYIGKDVSVISDIQRASTAYEKILEYYHDAKQCRRMEIKRVIFHDPATIVYWADGTKTVVKATNEKFDPEKGLAMAISKRALGDKGNYYYAFKEHLNKKEQNK